MTDSQSPETSTLLAGVDVGTTNIKAIVFDLRGRIVAQASLPTPTYFPRPGWAHYDPEELWQQTARAIRMATAQVSNPERIAGIAAASIGETGVPLDDQGQPTFEAIAWFDNRTESQIHWLNRRVGPDRIFAITGIAPLPMFSLCKLLWIKENAPEAFQRTTRWLLTADYIAYRLCGVAATDYSLASRTLALDIHRLQWSEEMLQAADVPLSIFAPLRPSGAPLGPVTREAAAETGLSTSTMVAAGGHDHVVGAFAVGVNEPGVLLNSLGTAEALFLPLDKPLTDPNVGRQGYTQGAHVAGRYYVFGGQYTMGGSVEWFRQTVGGGADYASLIAEAEETPPGSLGVQFLPHLRQASPPHVDVRTRGAFLGLSTDVTRGALFRAVLEGVAFESRSTLEPQLVYAGLDRPRAIVTIGGGARNPLLMRIKATVLNQPFTVIGVEEATALGAAVLGGLGAGVYPDRETAINSLQLDRSVVTPMPEHVALYETLYQEVYRHIYDTVRPLHHRIHELQHPEINP
jgi:xylulokinase